MKFFDLLPEWSKPVFLHAELALQFEEQKMNCASCSFVQGDKRDDQSTKEIYSSNLKCCTFFPDLANFAFGIEIRKGNKGRELLKSPDLTLPLGVFAPEKYKVKFQKSSFGTDASLLCPHFDRLNLNCSIWSSRPSSCVRFVCKSSLKSLGQKIWNETENLLRVLEVNFSYQAALEAGFVDEEIDTGSWNATPEEKSKFYIRTTDFVESLSAAQMIEIAGEEFKLAKGRFDSLARNL